MILAELGLIGTSVRLAFQPRTSSAPLILLVASFRLVLLVLVILVFGAAILIATAARAGVKGVFYVSWRSWL